MIAAARDVVFPQRCSGCVGGGRGGSSLDMGAKICAGRRLACAYREKRHFRPGTGVRRLTELLELVLRLDGGR